MTEKKRIMVIDDDNLVREIARDGLENEGYLVDTAVDANDAMEKIYNAPPDLVVLDIMMPGPDGLQFCKVLKDDEKTRQIPVILYTGQDNVPYKFKGEVSGAEAYVVKSDDLSELIKKVKIFLGGKREAV